MGHAHCTTTIGEPAGPEIHGSVGAYFANQSGTDNNHARRSPVTTNYLVYVRRVSLWMLRPPVRTELKRSTRHEPWSIGSNSASGSSRAIDRGYGLVRRLNAPQFYAR
jgi:hypothetical protein